VRELADRPVPARAVACALFLASLLAFQLPFVTVTADRRRAEATGFELAARDVTYEGTYIQESFRGEVEHWVGRGEAPALIAFVSLLAAAALVWIPWRAGPAIASTASLVALVAMFGLYQRVGSISALAVTVRHSGFWYALVFALAGGLWSTYVLTRTPWWWKPDLSGHRDYFA
jgi:hypothetical protein